MTVAANHFFSGAEPIQKVPKHKLTIGELVDRHLQATKRGEIENSKGKPIELQHSKQIGWAAERICGTKNLHTIYLSDFGEKINGVSKPIADFKAGLFTDGMRVLQQGEEYQSAAKSFNRFIRNFKALFKPEFAETIYSDIDLDDTAIALIRSVKLKRVEHKGFVSIDPAFLDKVDKHYWDINNLLKSNTPVAAGNIFMRYWLARCCGLRKTEILNARHDWLVCENGEWFVHVTHTAKYRHDNVYLDGWSSKSSNSRYVPIPEFLVKRLQARKTNQRKDEPIFHFGQFNCHQGPHEVKYREEWRRTVTSAGGDWKDIKKPTHHLRGEFITEVAHRSGGVTTAQAYAGHSDPLTTSRHYYDASRVKNRVVINPLGQ